MNHNYRWLIMLLLCCCAQPAAARVWTDATGAHSFEGDLIAASAETALLRVEEGELYACVIKELSESDRTFIKDYLKAQPAAKNPEQMQQWTGRDGFTFKGRVIGYGTRKITLSFFGDHLRVNKQPIREIDPIYKMMIPKIVAEFDDRSVKTETDLRKWGKKLRGKDRTLEVDGVLMRLANREEVAVPLFLFSEDERTVLEQGWDTWHAAASEQASQERESFLAEASAAEYQRSRAQQVKSNQQIQLMQLGMMAVNSGITNVWQVQLFPRPGVRARPMVVVLPGRNSGEASAMAIKKYPGYVTGAVRQMNN